MELSELLEQISTEQYKMLVILDNNREPDKIIKALEKKGWQAYDVTAALLKMLEELPEKKRRLRIDMKIKEWVTALPEKIILYNTTFLYSPELGKLNPVGAFKYRTRDREFIVFLEGQLSGKKIHYSQYGRPDYAEIDLEGVISTKLEDIKIDM